MEYLLNTEMWICLGVLLAVFSLAYWLGNREGHQAGRDAQKRDDEAVRKLYEQRRLEGMRIVKSLDASQAKVVYNPDGTLSVVNLIAGIE